MRGAKNILISLEPRYAESILSGSKIYELRKRAVRACPGTAVWIYSKIPEGRVVGWANIVALHSGSPAMLWRKCGSGAAVSREEYSLYFSHHKLAFALELDCASRLSRPIRLEELRSVDPAFQPPQFYKYLQDSDRVLKKIAARK